MKSLVPIPIYQLHLNRLNETHSMRKFLAGDRTFDFTGALHTYIEVSDIALAKVEGLKGLDYLDKVSNNSPSLSQGLQEWKIAGLAAGLQNFSKRASTAFHTREWIS